MEKTIDTDWSSENWYEEEEENYPEVKLYLLQKYDNPNSLIGECKNQSKWKLIVEEKIFILKILLKIKKNGNSGRILTLTFPLIAIWFWAIKTLLISDQL
jgi:hypothetical protein